VKRLFPITALFALAALAAPVSADNWPQWRGPKNDGHSAEKGLPTEWSADTNLAWKLKLPGPGAGTPAVWGENIFLTSADGADIVLLSIGTDGKEKWKQTLTQTGKKRYPNPSRGEVTDASASCTTDGKHVWSYVSNGKLTCHTVDGKPVWDTDLQSFGKYRIQFGCHWTPVVYKGKLYAQVMHRDAQLVVAFDALTGKELWHKNRPGYGMGESPDTYASAFIWEGEGGPLLVAHGNDYTTGHKLEDGTEVWRVQGLNPNSNRAWRFVSCPLITSNLIVVPSCKNGPTVGFNPVGAKGNIDPENKAELWRINNTPDVIAPVLVGEVVYYTADGPFTAIEAKTGKQIYREQLTKAIKRSNLVAADGKIYVTATNGATDVVQAGRTFKLLATNTLPDTFYGSPAIANGRIYLRGFDSLWAIGK
jgi:hypothetical protein